MTAAGAHGFLCRLLAAALFLAGSRPLRSAGLESSDVYVAKQEGYAAFRIPALVTASNGDLLAFCEGRRNDASDKGRIETVLKRSRDGGRSWTPLQVVWADGDNTCGNPTALIDQETRQVWLLMTWNLGEDSEKQILNGTSSDTRRVYVTHSSDNGATWSKPEEITRDVKPADWRWYATGPGNGIQLKTGPHRGRLVIPANHSIWRDGKPVYRSHAILSDDHGATWRPGGVEEELTNESAIAECSDGSLIQNMRSYHGKNRRAVARSRDGGETWSPVKLDDSLVEPVCQASLIDLEPAGPTRARPLVFSNPASLKREAMTVRASFDDGETWPVSVRIYSGPSAYSSLGVLRDGTVVCLYENGVKNPYEKISIARMPDGWLRR